MNKQAFENLLDSVCRKMTIVAQTHPYKTSLGFENEVRKFVDEELLINPENVDCLRVDFHTAVQGFPDIPLGENGIEVKFTLADTWRSVANSVLETNRVNSVRNIYIIFGKMGGKPEVRWGRYEECVMHVRTSHVPRFEVEIDTDRPLFKQFGISYDDFHTLPMSEKMQYIRKYARSRLKEGERLWWLADNEEVEHTLPMQARLYTSLSTEEKKRLRAEAVLLCPTIVGTRNSRHKYDDAVLFMMTYHGVLCHQARDLFSAGSVANPKNDDAGGVYIERALILLQDEMRKAAEHMEDELFLEYWGKKVPKGQRLLEWLKKADEIAVGWTPSNSLFLEEQGKNQ